MTRIIPILALAAVAGLAAASQGAYHGTIAKTSEYIRQTMAADGIVGASVALLDGEEVVWQQGFGWADREQGIAVTPETVFHIGSVSKMFATVALLMLVDEGKVALDAPVTRYLPAFRLRLGHEGITVRMLLAHTSGIPGTDYVSGFTTAPITDYNRRMLAWLAEQYPQYPTGYVAVYTNSGFNLVDEIVATVSGKPYAQFVRERIAVPLGMSRTGVDWLDPALAANLSMAYVEGKVQVPESVNLLGTGGLSSTPADLCRFLAMVNGSGTAFGRRLLKAETVVEMNRDQTAGNTVRIPGAGLVPGLGWDEYAEPGLAYAGAAPTKNGGTLLFGTQIMTLPAYHLAAAVTLNSVDSAAARSIAERMLMDALEERYGIPAPGKLQTSGSTPAAFDLTTLEGAYGSTSISGIWDLRVKGAQVELWARRGNSFRLLYGKLTHREGGWLGSDENPGTQFAVRSVGGREVLLMRESQGHYWAVRVMGERLGAAPSLSAAWKARLGKTWVGVDIDIANYYFDSLLPGLRLTEREGRLVYEELSGTASSGDARERLPFLRRAATADGLTDTSMVLEPLDDWHAWTPLQIDCRDLTHLQVIARGNEEWLRVGVLPTLWRPLDGVPQPDGARPLTASIAPELAEWVKLPAAGAEYVLTAPDGVHWALYDENLRPVFTAWGGAWRLGKPAGSKTSTLYLALYSLTPQQAVVQRLEGRSFDAESGVRPLSR